MTNNSRDAMTEFLDWHQVRHRKTEAHLYSGATVNTVNDPCDFVAHAYATTDEMLIARSAA